MARVLISARLFQNKKSDHKGRIFVLKESQSCGKWFVSIQTDREIEQSAPTATSAIGIDVGIASRCPPMLVFYFRPNSPLFTTECHGFLELSGF